MPSAENAHFLSDTDEKTLLQLARRVIEQGCKGVSHKVSTDDYPIAVRAERACFVTLEKAGELRGCIGTMQAREALVNAVADYAWASAFRDYRFQPVTADELDSICIEISVLSPLEMISCSSEAELIAQLTPHHHGLVIEDDQRHATFLPQVWEKLPDPEAFINQLKRKAGIDEWHEQMHCFRYTVSHFSEQDYSSDSHFSDQTV